MTGIAKRADQFVLEIRVAHEKSKRLRTRATEVRSKPNALETAPKVLFLVCVDQSRQPHSQPWRAQCIQEFAGVVAPPTGRMTIRSAARFKPRRCASASRAA